MDKELEKILKKADKFSDSDKKGEAPVKIFPPNAPYDYLVFTQLNAFSGFSTIILLIIIPLLLCIGFFFSDFVITTIYILLVYALLISIYAAINYFRYKHVFIGWQEKLPYELKGWSEMIAAKKMFCDLCWNDTKVSVELKNDAPEMKQLITAVFQLFCERSKKAFYTKKTGSSSLRYRQDWKITSDFTMEGSANPEVMRYLKDLFEKELSIIAHKTGKIQAVKVELLSEEFEVKILIDSGD